MTADIPPEDELIEESSVRSYVVTRGRTRPSGDALPIEALVSALGQPAVQQTPEMRKILELTASQYLSVAELSAHVHLPVGVVRVVVGDLVDQGLARVHGPATTQSSVNSATTLSVLESVLNGISAL